VCVCAFLCVFREWLCCCAGKSVSRASCFVVRPCACVVPNQRHRRALREKKEIVLFLLFFYWKLNNHGRFHAADQSTVE
uniref:Secreted protein n=1 Tax=Anopheles quadriannulatus TaxID=34691 RepID=A0A182XRD1_ANOQN